MSLQRLDCVRGATRIVATRGRQQGAQTHLIRAHDEDERPFHVIRSARLPISPRSRANDASYASRRARTSTSPDPSRGRSSCRVSSRSRRLSLFLRTAVNPNLGTTIATRICPDGESIRRTSNICALTRWPERRIRSMSGERVIRRSRGNPRRGSGAGVFARQPDRQTLAALSPAARQGCSAPLRLHARTKPVGFDAAFVPGAVCRLSHSCSNNQKKVRSGSMAVGGIDVILTSHSSLPTEVTSGKRIGGREITQVNTTSVAN